jgi:hypothetical protein
VKRSLCLIILAASMVPALGHAATDPEPVSMTTREFVAYAELQAKLTKLNDRLYELLKEDESVDQKALMAQSKQINDEIGLVKKQLREAPGANVTVEQVHAYCTQEEYKSAWCDDLLKSPSYEVYRDRIKAQLAQEAARKRAEEVEARNREVASIMKDFQACAGDAVDLESERKQYQFNLALYKSGFSSITYSDISARQRELVQHEKKFNKNCNHNWRLPTDQARSLCDHPAYRSEWCSNLLN